MARAQGPGDVHRGGARHPESRLSKDHPRMPPLLLAVVRVSLADHFDCPPVRIGPSEIRTFTQYIAKAAEYLGLSVKTLQRWDRKGILKPMRTKTNRRVYTKAQLDEHLGRQASITRKASNDPGPASSGPALWRTHTTAEVPAELAMG